MCNDKMTLQPLEIQSQNYKNKKQYVVMVINTTICVQVTKVLTGGLSQYITKSYYCWKAWLGFFWVGFLPEETPKAMDRRKKLEDRFSQKKVEETEETKKCS